MSLKPEGINPVPEETARIAHAAYPKGNKFMHMRDKLGTIYQDESFAPLFSHTGQPAEAPWHLALVTIMQFAEGLSDLQAAMHKCSRCVNTLNLLRHHRLRRDLAPASYTQMTH